MLKKLFSNNLFLKKFSRYLLVGLSSMVLVASSQQAVLSEVFQRDTNIVLAQSAETAPSGGSASCAPGGAASFSWTAASRPDASVVNYTIRINKTPGEVWAPNDGSGDVAYEAGNVTSSSTQLTVGDYPDWTVQAGYSDGAVGQKSVTFVLPDRKLHLLF